MIRATGKVVARWELFWVNLVELTQPENLCFKVQLSIFVNLTQPVTILNASFCLLCSFFQLLAVSSQ